MSNNFYINKYWKIISKTVRQDLLLFVGGFTEVVISRIATESVFRIINVIIFKITHIANNLYLSWNFMVVKLFLFLFEETLKWRVGEMNSSQLSAKKSLFCALTFWMDINIFLWWVFISKTPKFLRVWVLREFDNIDQNSYEGMCISVWYKKFGIDKLNSLGPSQKFGYFKKSFRKI